MLRRSFSKKRGLGSVTKTVVSHVATSKLVKIAVENVNHPGHVTRVDPHMYECTKQ